jgi:hypothetical protein
MSASASDFDSTLTQLSHCHSHRQSNRQIKNDKSGQGKLILNQDPWSPDRPHLRTSNDAFLLGLEFVEPYKTSASMDSLHLLSGLELQAPAAGDSTLPFRWEGKRMVFIPLSADSSASV